MSFWMCSYYSQRFFSWLPTQPPHWAGRKAENQKEGVVCAHSYNRWVSRGLRLKYRPPESQTKDSQSGNVRRAERMKSRAGEGVPLTAQKDTKWGSSAAQGPDAPWPKMKESTRDAFRALCYCYYVIPLFTRETLTMSWWRKWRNCVPCGPLLCTHTICHSAALV